MNGLEMRLALRFAESAKFYLGGRLSDSQAPMRFLLKLTSEPAFKHQVPRARSNRYGCNEEPKNPVVYPIQTELEWLQKPKNVGGRWHSALVNEDGRFRVIVSFENAEDAVLFKMRFGG